MRQKGRQIERLTLPYGICIVFATNAFERHLNLSFALYAPSICEPGVYSRNSWTQMTGVQPYGRTRKRACLESTILNVTTCNINGSGEKLRLETAWTFHQETRQSLESSLPVNLDEISQKSELNAHLRSVLL